MTDIATGRRPRSSKLDKFPAAFAVAGAKQEKAADEETLILLQRFSGHPEIDKARVEIGRAQEVEERFHRTTMISMGSISRCDSPDSWEYYFTSEPPPAYRRSIGHLAEALDTRIGINAEARLTRRPHPILRS